MPFNLAIYKTEELLGLGKDAWPAPFREHGVTCVSTKAEDHS